MEIANIHEAKSRLSKLNEYALTRIIHPRLELFAYCRF